MKTQIPWCGFRTEMRYQVKQLDIDGVTAIPLRNMGESFSHLQQNTEYPILIVQDWFNSLIGFDMPQHIINRDWPTDYTQHFLKNVRELPHYKDTKIIIPHYNLNEGELEKLTVGNVTFFDLTKFNLDGWSNLVRNNLRQAQQVALKP